MVRVWPLMEGNEGSELIALYSSRALAEQHRDNLNKRHWDRLRRMIEAEKKLEHPKLEWIKDWQSALDHRQSLLRVEEWDVSDQLVERGVGVLIDGDDDS